MDFNLFETDRKGIMVALAILSENLTFEKAQSDRLGLYLIKSKDGNINIELDLHNHEENSISHVKELLEYCHNEREFSMSDIKDDYDILQTVYKFANGIMLRIEHEGVAMEKEKLRRNDMSSSPTHTQYAIFYKILHLDDLLAECYNIDDDSYFAMSIGRFIADSVNQANVFFDYSELFWGIKTTAILACAGPCHEDDRIRQFAKNMLSLN